MQLLSLLAVGGLTASVSARSARSVGKKTELPRPRLTVPETSLRPHKRQTTQIITTEASKGMVNVYSYAPLANNSQHSL